VKIDRERVIERHIDRNSRADAVGGIPHAFHRASNGGQIAEQRNAGGAVEHDARDGKWKLGLPLRIRLPVCEGAHLALGHALFIAIAEQRFEHDAQRHRKT
jgi:hypothetical protein